MVFYLQNKIHINFNNIFNFSVYWKFVITGTDNNTEFKVWDLVTWNCLQTITFSCNIDKTLRFIAELDRTSSYFVVSSLETRTCYVMQIINNTGCYPSIKMEISDSEEAISKDNSATSVTSSHLQNSMPPVFIKSISEFPLSSGILSFSIVDAAVRRYKCSNENYMCEELEDYDEETSSIYCVIVHMFIVQAKSMQECHILYQPTVTENADVKSTMSNSDASTDSNKSVPSVSETDERTADNFNYDILGENKEPTDVKIPSIKDEFSTSKSDALGILLDRTSTLSMPSSANVPSNTSGSTEVAVASVTPTAIDAGNNVEPRNTSPKISLKNTSFSQLNLMTPEAFNSTLSVDNGTYER